MGVQYLDNSILDHLDNQLHFLAGLHWILCTIILDMSTHVKSSSGPKEGCC